MKDQAGRGSIFYFIIYYQQIWDQAGILFLAVNFSFYDILQIRPGLPIFYFIHIFLDQGHLFFILLALYFIWVFEYATEPTERIQIWKRMRVKRNIAETEFTSISLQQSLRPFFKIFYLCVHVRVIF